MSYERLDLENGTVLNEDHLRHFEDGIEEGIKGDSLNWIKICDVTLEEEISAIESTLEENGEYVEFDGLLLMAEFKPNEALTSPSYTHLKINTNPSVTGPNAAGHYAIIMAGIDLPKVAGQTTYAVIQAELKGNWVTTQAYKGANSRITSQLNGYMPLLSEECTEPIKYIRFAPNTETMGIGTRIKIYARRYKG